MASPCIRLKPQVKPFTPEEAKEIVMTLQKPVVFSNMTFDWPVLRWNVTHLASLLAGKKIVFRIGRKDTATAPLFETECAYAEATLDDFLAWNGRQQPCPSGPFSSYDLCKYWMYADYKYIDRLFEDKPEHFQDIKWSDFGFPGRSGKESTLWIGSTGANTPCHLDSYGCNLVLQVQGRRNILNTWVAILFQAFLLKLHSVLILIILMWILAVCSACCIISIDQQEHGSLYPFIILFLGQTF
uniref:HSPB1 associated protein 1 n=1 Tax=Laticauda laticaudata TaxID=8630 RepID=A0A8C5SW67_LATLA